MYKLSGHSLTRGTFFLPETQPMILQERDSSCTLQLSPDGPEIGFNDWILDDDWPEGNYVWRVKSLDDTVTSETRQIGLEHIIKILDDTSLFGEITTADIAGQAGASTVSAKQAVQYILGQQSDWVLGDFEYESVSNPYEFGGESLLDALGSVTETLEDAVWEYDLSVYPFKLHIRHRSGTVSCEMRGGRNLSTLKRSVNRSGMYTRIYPVGKNDLHLDSVYLSKNENVYGRVDKIETDQSKSTKENLQAWAQGRLNKHCEPTVSITISGLELSGETGESLDNLKLNKVCQCPLPEFNTTITERIVKKQWRDRRKEPENVTVNLCNSSADVATIIKEQSRGGGKGAAGQAKQNYLFEANENHLYYEVFDECGHLHSVLEMTTESLRIGFDNLIESTRSEFLMTSESLRIQFENEIASTRSQFEMTSESLRIQFENEIASTRSQFEMTSESLRIQFENEINSTRSQFEMTSESLRIEFQNTTSSLRSAIQAEAGKIAMVVGTNSGGNFIKAAEIATSINNAGEGVATIDADKIMIGNEKSTTVINGKVDASQLTAQFIGSKIAQLATLTAQAIGCSGVSADDFVSADSLEANSLSLGGKSCTDFIKSASVSGNTLTLTFLKGGTVTFSKAASVTLSGAWSGNSFVVSASDSSIASITETFSTAKGTGEGSGGGLVTLDTFASHKAYAYVKSTRVGGGNGVLFRIVADATSEYNNGAAAVTLSQGSWSNGVLTVTASNGNTSNVSIPASSGTTWTNTEDDKWRADLTIGGVTRHSTVKNFASIRTAGANSVTLSQGSWSDGTLTVTASNSKTTTVSLPSVSSTTWQDRGSGKWRARLTIGGAYRYSSEKDFSSLLTAQYNAGYNQALSDAGVPNGGVVYTAAGWYNTLYQYPDSSHVVPVYNCATGATNHQLTKK